MSVRNAWHYAVFASINLHTWWFGALAGALQGILLLVMALAVLPFVHPRMASEYHGVTELRQLEPPGFLAMNYKCGTPVTTLLAQIVYGATLGWFLELNAAM